MTTTLECPHGTFGLDICRGEVTLVNGEPLCNFHRLKREVFGLSPSRPVAPSPNREACPTCGHTWIVLR